MKLIKKTLMLLSLLLCFLQSSEAEAFLGLFEDNNVSMVKNNVLEYDKSITVQDAFEGNQFFLDPAWTSLKGSQNRNYVEFKATVDMQTLYAHFDNFEIPPQVVPPIDFPVIFIQQFLVNKDNTFMPSYSAFMVDGVPIYETKNMLLVLDMLTHIYQNMLPRRLFINLAKQQILDMYLAIQNNNIDTMNTLIESGFDINISPHTLVPPYLQQELYSSIENCTTPLILASRYGNVEMVNFLISKGADLNTTSSYISPLISALNAGKNSKDIVKILISNGANPSLPEYTTDIPLLLALKSEQYDLIELLLNNGADPHKRDNRGASFVDYVITSENMELLQLLLNSGFDINSVSEFGITPLMYATKTSRNTVKFILDHGADVNFQNKNGITALMYTTNNFQGNTGVVRLLLERGADMSLQDNNGRTAYFYSRNTAAQRVLDDFEEKNNNSQKLPPSPHQNSDFHINEDGITGKITLNNREENTLNIMIDTSEPISARWICEFKGYCTLNANTFLCTSEYEDLAEGIFEGGNIRIINSDDSSICGMGGTIKGLYTPVQ